MCLVAAVEFSTKVHVPNETFEMADDRMNSAQEDKRLFVMA